MSPANTKICAHCHKDCSTRPRVKDSHGNYYCKVCHDAANQRLQSHESKKPESQKSPLEPVAVATADLEDDFLALDDSFVPMQDHEHKHDHGDLLEPYASSSKPDLDDSDLGGVLTSPALDQESEPEKQHDPVLDLDINLNHEDSHDTDEMLLMETDGDVPPLLEKASDTPADDLDKSKPDLPSKMANEPFARVDNATDPPHLEDKPASDNN